MVINDIHVRHRASPQGWCSRCYVIDCSICQNMVYGYLTCPWQTTRNYEHVSLYFTMKEAFLLWWTGHALCLAGEQVSASALIMDAYQVRSFRVLMMRFFGDAMETRQKLFWASARCHIRTITARRCKCCVICNTFRRVQLWTEARTDYRFDVCQ